MRAVHIGSKEEHSSGRAESPLCVTQVRGFANSIHTVDGGTHMEGLRAGLTRAVTQLGRKAKQIKVRQRGPGLGA